MAIVTGEALFPAAYTTSQNTISDLGSTWQPGDIVREPSATSFNTAMLVSGAMIVAAAGAHWRAYRSRSVAIALLLLGVGMLGVGSFPGTEIGGHPSTAGLHPPLSMLTFIAGGLCGVLAYRVTTAPFRYLSAMLGLVSLGSLVLSGPLSASDLGAGGIQRWVAYPVVLWVVAFGGYLLGAGAPARGPPDPRPRGARSVPPAMDRARCRAGVVSRLFSMRWASRSTSAAIRSNASAGVFSAQLARYGHETSP